MSALLFSNTFVFAVNQNSNGFLSALTPGPCSFSSCQTYYGQCIVAANGTAQCICPSADQCPAIKRRICGDDGKTYANTCVLEVQSCQMKKRIEVHARGKCCKYSS